MTIALSLKVNDGIVLAVDSASTLIGQATDEHGQPTDRLEVKQIYNNANKVFNNPKRYRIKDVAELLKQFMFDQLYNNQFKDYKPDLGFLIAGYSASANLPEVYLIETSTDSSPKPVLQELSLVAKGMPDAINRLVYGFSSKIVPTLIGLGLTEDQVVILMPQLFRRLGKPLITEGMPLQDAIELAEFLVDTTIKYQRFSFDEKMVGGPIEIAAISKYEGLKWIKRKHYYSQELNPDDLYERSKKSTLYIPISTTRRRK